MTRKQMDAIRLHRLGDPGSLALERIETPRPGAGEVLVRVHAAAITRDELDWPEGRLPAVPSYELSGVVEELGDGVEGVAIGDEVFALCDFDRDGVASEYATVRAANVAAKPRTLTHIQSAALPLATLSAWQGLFDHGKLSAGQRVVVHGVGGVGSFAVQLARAHGGHVIASTSANRMEAARQLGAAQVFEPNEDLAGKIEPVDLVFDTAGGERLRRSPEYVRNGGKVVSVAVEPPTAAGDRQIESIYFIVEPKREQLIEIARLADQGLLRPEIDEVFPLADARQAFERTTSPHQHGKIVLSVRKT
jgi:NADPH:quinone reductase-like Zn-dependent oxidoreductase